MGEVHLDKEKAQLQISADLFFYGNASSDILAKNIAADIAAHWNEPGAAVQIEDKWFDILFIVTGTHTAALTPSDVIENINPRNNYFRVEQFAGGNISFVDGINSNTGYFKLENLLHNSTTAAHEFGHTIGLDHPDNLDIRGKGVPGIMYPRGTIVDPVFQYDPLAQPGRPGGTMNPFTRKVQLEDIAELRLHTLPFNESGVAVLGGFSSVWHEAHQV